MQIPIESISLLMLNVGYVEHDGDWNWQNVNSPFSRIYCVTEGEARIHFSNKVVTCRPGHLYIIPAYTTHSYECSGHFAHYYLHVSEGFKQETDVFELYDLPAEVASTDDDLLLFQRMIENHPYAHLPESNPSAYDNTASMSDYVRRYVDMPLYQKMQLRGSILILFSRFMACANPRVWTMDKRLSHILSFINNHIYEPLDLDRLSAEVCLTRNYLIRLFKRHMGTSPIQYINRRKMERAQLMLLTQDTPVKEIAYSMGFNDHSYFIRLFRKLMGVTPQEYRRTMS